MISRFSGSQTQVVFQLDQYPALTRGEALMDLVADARSLS
jgi:hypothetical protein